jgi:hypothetical protein
MNRLFNVIVIGTLLSLCSQIASADCQVSISQHDVNYGQIRRSDIVNTVKQWSSLADRQIHLLAYCTEPQKMALFFDGKTGEQTFAFGDNSRLIVTADHAMLDGKVVQLNHTANHDIFVSAGRTSAEHPVRAGQGLMPVSGSEVLMGQQFSVTLTLKPMLNRSELSTRDRRDLSSAIQISVESQ